MASDPMSIGRVLETGPGGELAGRLRAIQAQSVTQNVRTQSDFASVLGIQNRVAHADAGTPEQQAKRIAEEFVAKVFIEPVLKEVREGNDTPPPFGPGQGEKQFAGLMDAQRSIEMVRSASWPIVDRLAADMTRSAMNRSAMNSGSEITAESQPRVGISRTG
jgi:hypothetical protein